MDGQTEGGQPQIITLSLILYRVKSIQITKTSSIICITLTTSIVHNHCTQQGYSIIHRLSNFCVVSTTREASKTREMCSRIDMQTNTGHM